MTTTGRDQGSRLPGRKSLLLTHTIVTSPVRVLHGHSRCVAYAVVVVDGLRAGFLYEVVIISHSSVPIQRERDPTSLAQISRLGPRTAFAQTPHPIKFRLDGFFGGCGAGVGAESL